MSHQRREGVLLQGKSTSSVILHFHSPSRSVRSSADTRLLKLPLYRYKTKDDRAFSHFGTSVWNSLPPHIGNAATITTFGPLENTPLQPVSV